MGKVAVIVGSVLVSVMCLSAKVMASPEDDFRKANEHYEAKSYDSAIVSYTLVLDQGLESPALYFNLGNAYFRTGDLGHATLYYLRARRLAPDDADIRDNLAFARRFTSVQMEGVELNPVRSLVESLLATYSLTMLAWVSSILFIALLLLLTIRFGTGWRVGAMRIVIIPLLVLTGLGMMATTLKYRYDYLVWRGVLVAEDCPVRTGPSDQSEIELAGAPGLVVEILSESGEYYNVLFENKRRGWILKELVAVV
ncbi:MAG: tetratricopeptide repeat protein [Planctomycetota bacterium]